MGWGRSVLERPFLFNRQFNKDLTVKFRFSVSS
jgi:hypothetical protein